MRATATSGTVGVVVPTDDGVERLKKRGMRIFFRKGNIRDALTELLESGELGL